MSFSASFRNNGYSIKNFDVSLPWYKAIAGQRVPDIKETPVSINENNAKEGLTNTIKSKKYGSDVSKIATELGINKDQFWHYLINNHDTDGTKGSLSAEEIANGIVALDKANGLDGTLDVTKLEEKTPDAGHDKPSGGEHDAGHGSKSDAVKNKDKKTQAIAKREKVADKDEDQNGLKASLRSEDGATVYHETWTIYANRLNKGKDVASVADIKCMFGITDAAAKAIYAKAHKLNPNNLTDGVGQILREIDMKSGGDGDGKLTIGEFNDYVEDLMAASPEKTKEKSGKTSKGGGGSSSKKVDSKDHTEVDKLEEKIAALEKEIAELKKANSEEESEQPVTAEAKKNGSKKWLLAGAGILAAGAAFFAIKDRRDRQQYAQHMQNRPPFGPPPLPFCPPPQPRFYAPPFNGPANQNLFGNVFAQG